MIYKPVLRPYVYTDLIRIGNPRGDGGYVVPRDLVDSADALLSLGLAEEWSFDIGMQKRNPSLRVIGVDHSIRASTFFRRLVRSTVKGFVYSLLRSTVKSGKYAQIRQHNTSYFQLFTDPSVHIRKMVATNDSDGCISFTSLMKLAAPKRDHSVFLKMDIESSEYDVISQIVAHESAISAVAAEFHDLVSDSATFNRAILELQQAFVIVHIHANNHGTYSQEQDFPDTVEITFVNKALMGIDPELSTCAYPRPDLDVTNNIEKADYELHF